MDFSFLVPYDRRKCPVFKNTQQTGYFGERVAEAFLKRKGYKTLVRNYETEYGEIDLVCRHDKTLVFVEVKARGENAVERPATAVTSEKQKKMIKTAKIYLSELADDKIPARFDIVEVYLKPDAPPRCELFQSAFQV